MLVEVERESVIKKCESGSSLKAHPRTVAATQRQPLRSTIHLCASSLFPLFLLVGQLPSLCSLSAATHLHSEQDMIGRLVGQWDPDPGWFHQCCTTLWVVHSLFAHSRRPIKVPCQMCRQFYCSLASFFSSSAQPSGGRMSRVREHVQSKRSHKK